MASPSGGQFVFVNGAKDVHLGLSSAPATIAGAYNIEVFVNPGTTTLPSLAAGFDAGVIVSDSVGSVALTGPTSQELLGGQTLTLFGGDYGVIDAGADTVLSHHQAVTIQGGSGDQTVTGFSGDTIVAGPGAEVINATKGSMAVTLGGGAATVFGNGGGNTVAFGSVGQYLEDGPGTKVTLGTSGTDTVYGFANDTITAVSGSHANLLFNPLGRSGGESGPGREVINLAGSTGDAVINAFQFIDSGGIVTQTAMHDTITAGSGNDSIFAGGGDRVGVGMATQAAGGHVWFDSDSGTGAAAFGTNDTVAGVTYGNLSGAVTLTGAVGASSATVSVGGFNSLSGGDTIFYASRSTTNQDSSIIATAQSNGASTTIVLPDGTTMILAGVASAAGLKFTS